LAGKPGDSNREERGRRMPGTYKKAGLAQEKDKRKKESVGYNQKKKRDASQRAGREKRGARQNSFVNWPACIWSTNVRTTRGTTGEGRGNSILYQIRSGKRLSGSFRETPTEW